MELLHSGEHKNFIPEFYSSKVCLKNGYTFDQAKQFDFFALLYFASFSPFLLMKPDTNVYFVLSSFLYPAAIQVQITPAQGEISVGESKFFLCEGKSYFKHTSCNTAWCKCHLIRISSVLSIFKYLIIR